MAMTGVPGLGVKHANDLYFSPIMAIVLDTLCDFLSILGDGEMGVGSSYD